MHDRNTNIYSRCLRSRARITMMLNIKSIIIIVWICCTLQVLCQGVARPILQTELTLRWPATPKFYGSGIISARTNPQVVNLASNTFAVVDFDEQITVAIVSNLTDVNRVTFPIESLVPAVINSPADSSVIIFYSDGSLNGRALRALKVDQSGQKVFDDVVGIPEETISAARITACRINDTFVAVTVNSPTPVFYLFNEAFELVGRMNYTSDIRSIQVECTSDYIFLMIEYLAANTFRTRYEKYDPNDLTGPIATLHVNSSMHMPQGFISGSKLVVALLNGITKKIFAGQIDIATMTLEGNWTEITSAYDIGSSQLFPVFTQAGYGTLVSKWISPWTEYAFTFDVNGNAKWAVPFLMTVNQPFYSWLQFEQAKHYVQPNGYILSFKDVDQRTNSSVITLQFYGDVCGDVIVSGDEQCDGGAHCTYCQCDEGAQVLTPRGIGCFKDTPPGTATEPSSNSSPSAGPNSSNSPNPSDPAAQNSPNQTGAPSNQQTSLSINVLPSCLTSALACVSFFLFA